MSVRDAPSRRQSQTASDSQLMAALMRQDRLAAQELYDRLAPRVLGLGKVMLGTVTLAEDLLQDTFVKVWRKAGSYDSLRGSLDNWVLLIARSLAIDTIRRRVVEARVLARLGMPETATDATETERSAETHDLAARARRAMESLPAGQRAALELAYYGGKTSIEVAELEGIPVGTAKTRIRVALLRLREALEVRDEV